MQRNSREARKRFLAVSSGFGPAWRVDGEKIVSLTAWLSVTVAWKRSSRYGRAGVVHGGVGLTAPWRVTHTEFDAEQARLDLHLEFGRGTRFPCPVKDCAHGASAKKLSITSRIVTIKSPSSRPRVPYLLNILL